MVTSIADVLDFWKEADATKQIGVTVPLAELRALVAEVGWLRNLAAVHTVPVAQPPTVLRASKHGDGGTIYFEVPR